MPARVHHSAICVTDVDASLRFYRDGLGLEVVMDEEFDGDWPTLFGARSTRLRSVMLGDPAAADAGIVELVSFADGVEPAAVSQSPARGFFLLSLFVDLDAVMAQLRALGFEQESHITVPSPRGDVPMVTIRDPDGVLVELIGTSSADTRVATRADGALPEESDVARQNRGTQAEAILAESDARSVDPATVDGDREHVERRRTDETVDPSD